MRIRQLLVRDFAAIREADIEFGPGLNVLYGPNDLGKSTLADAIRLALLLPHTSSHAEEYFPWTGGQSPVVELTFETEAQRIWRVRKEFRKGGASVLEESKNNVDFDEVASGRSVDGKLRDLLHWGIPEPGGKGGSKGLPSSFLATVLLSTQSQVSDILSDSLQGDASGTGKERIAAALQAVAQDPLFVALLRDTQARRDAAYTEKGAKKTAKGSVFKDAADRLREARDEKERLQKIVEDSEGVERQLRDLTAKRDQRESVVVAATDRTKSLELLFAQAAALTAAEEQVRVAREDVERIRAIGAEVEAAERAVTPLALGVTDAGQKLQAAHEQLKEEETAFKAAEDAAKAVGADSSTDAAIRTGLELRRVTADQAAREAQRRIDDALGAQGLVDHAEAAEVEHRNHKAEADRAHTLLTEASAKERAATEQMRRLDLLERALESQAADERVRAAQADLDNEVALRERLESETRDRDAIASARAAIAVPDIAALAPMRRLATDIARARGALDVGLVVTVTPERPLNLRVQKDGTTAENRPIDEPLEIEANTQVDIDLVDIATVRIRGGRRRAQEAIKSLEERWDHEVVPFLTAVTVKDLEALSAKVEEARVLDVSLAAKDVELEALRLQITALASSADSLRDALERSKAARVALGDVSFTAFSSELASLGMDPLGALRKRRQQISAEEEAARSKARQAETDHTLAEERTRSSKAALDAAAVARDTALMAFPAGIAPALSEANESFSGASKQQARIATELATLKSTIAAETARIEAAVSSARAALERARTDVDLAQQAQTKAIAEHASQTGRLEELRRLRDSQDLPGAEKRLREASDRLAVVPVPARMVSDTEVTEARNAEARAKSDLDWVVLDIQRTHGALEQVGGSVARERLHDAIEAFELAEHHEREVEAEYDAWLLLLQQMKEAEAAQASNLGQTLAPAIACRFEELTQKRYEDVRLTAELATEGVMSSGALRSTERISVGTREQLSTLYRLALAEYLKTVVVLDDQLVQSDEDRMDWFRDLLAEKAKDFQIIVFTCRPNDYLAAGAVVENGKAYKDSAKGFRRAMNLQRTIHRR
jgi:hypothetical protein